MSITLDGGNTTTTGIINSGTAVASTLGTSITFTGIPVGVKRVTIALQGVSTNGSTLCVQLGTSGGFVTSGYLGCTGDGGTPLNYSADFRASPGFASGSFVVHGIYVITNIAGNTWVEQHNVAASSSAVTAWGAGSIALSGVLDRVRVTTANGTDVFDAGSINILYE